MHRGFSSSDKPLALISSVSKSVLLALGPTRYERTGVARSWMLLVERQLLPAPTSALLEPVDKRGTGVAYRRVITPSLDGNLDGEFASHACPQHISSHGSSATCSALGSRMTNLSFTSAKRRLRVTLSLRLRRQAANFGFQIIPAEER